MYSRQGEFRTITASKAGTCKRCGGEIEVGQRIRWAPRKGAYHLKAECGEASGPWASAQAEADRAEERRELAYWERVDNYRELGYDPN